MTKFLNISIDTSLGGSSASDTTVSSQKAIKAYADTKQEQLVSGTNIKTVNKEGILGSGNLNTAKYSMPSSKYDTLTFGASGTSYTAPANGYFLIMCNIAAGNWCQISSSTGFIAHTSAGASGDFSLFCPVRVGDVVTLSYTGTSLPQVWNFFRFYYSEGDNV